MLTLLGSFDPNSILLNGDFANLALSLQRYLELYPHVGEKFQLDQNYFVDYLLDFEKETQNEECAASILYSLGYYYTNQDDFDNAKDILLYFKKKYPTNYYVANGIIDKNLASLKIRPGFKAPEFSIRTLDGDSLRLSDFQGKFLLIDFWGTWCGPCRGEIPHLKKLFANMPQDTFALLGIARDDSSSLRKYIEEENILYPNAIAPEEVLNRFGITGYPTTLLIDPQGQIIGKNLRGSNIEDLVRGKMNEYNKMSTI
jgi:peroxiredoxin